MVKGSTDIAECIFSSEELPIYECESIKDIIDYKWRVFSRPLHRTGASIHIVYMLTLIVYINEVFLSPEIVYNEDGLTKISPPPVKIWLQLIMVCLIYPLAYDGTQMYKAGWQYF